MTTARAIQYPISFSHIKDPRIKPIFENPHNLTRENVRSIGEKTGLLALSKVVKGGESLLQFSRPYAAAALEAASALPLPTSPLPSRRPQGWLNSLIQNLHRVADREEYLKLMANEICGFYLGIIRHSVEMDDGRLYVTGSRNTQGVRPMDYVGVNKNGIANAHYERFLLGLRGGSYLAYYALYSEPTDTGTSIASRIMWHIPGTDSEANKEHVGALLCQMSDPALPVSLGLLYGQAQFVHARAPE